MILPPHRRGDLTERQWKRLVPLLPAQKLETGRPRLRPRRVVGDKGYSSGTIRRYLRRWGIRVNDSAQG